MLTLMKNISFKIFVIAALLLQTNFLTAQDENTPPQPEVGIVENLDGIIPSGIILNDENGKPVDVKSLITKPTLFSLVYFRCPGICSPLLNGVMTVVDKTELEPSKDYNLITISFDQSEDYKLAAGKKESYLAGLDKKIPQESWRFLTGDSANIKRIADALGFKFQRQGNDFMHGAAIMMVSPEGKIVRYLYGTDYLPFDLKMAVIEAAEGKSVPTINKLMKLCFSFDPEGRKYVLNITRIAGGSVLLLLGIFIGVLTLKRKKKLNR
ncbi:MAG: SCO family protein [Ignavibacteria bacterium]